MPNAGDCFQVQLSNTHISWGTHRYTDSRDSIQCEVYLPIPAKYARSYDIYNSNHDDATALGINLYKFKAFSDKEEVISGVLKSQGCVTKGDVHAKNLSGHGNLKLLSPWIHAAGITVGDTVEVLFTSPTSIELRKL